MTVLLDTSFVDAFKKITDTSIIRRVNIAVEKLEAAKLLREISNIKSMKGKPNYYRIRFGDFRIGFRLVDETTIVLLYVDSRSVFYKYFPSKFQ